MNFIIRNVVPTDLEAIFLLLPRLANFDLPSRRAPEDLWRGDANLLQQWADEGNENFFALAAVNNTNEIMGVAMVSLRQELLSYTPSTHLEVLVVAKQAEGQGVGKALMTAAEREAQQRGAKSMSLNVFVTNHRARRLYAKSGYHEELIRHIKFFETAEP